MNIDKKMIKPNIKIEIKPAYAGGVAAKATINDKQYLLNLKNIEQVIQNQINERGFTTNKTSRQKYTRLLINN